MLGIPWVQKKTNQNKKDSLLEKEIMKDLAWFFKLMFMIQPIWSKKGSDLSILICEANFAQLLEWKLHLIIVEVNLSCFNYFNVDPSKWLERLFSLLTGPRKDFVCI